MAFSVTLRVKNYKHSVQRSSKKLLEKNNKLVCLF